MKSAFLTLTLATSALLAAEPAKPAPALQSAPSTAKVVDLRVESQTNPTAVNTPLPRFSWRIETEERGWLQGSYRILVASSAKLLAKHQADLWDSGESPGRASQFIGYAGSPLATGQTAHWKVILRDYQKQMTSWSEPATFTIKLIGPEPLPNPVFAPDGPRLSSFECSDPILNSIYETAASALPEITNLRDISLGMRAAAYHRPITPHCEIWLRHFNNSVNSAGYLPAILPSNGSFASTQSDAAIKAAHSIWWMTGDISVLEKSLDSFRSYISARRKADPKGQGLPFGDLPADTLPQSDPTPPEFFHLAIQAYNLRLVLEIGRNASRYPYELHGFKEIFEGFREPFKQTHLHEDGNLKYDSIPAHLVTLRSGLLSSTKAKNTVKNDLMKLLNTPQNASPLTQGPFAAHELLPVLTLAGEHDRAVALAKSQDPAKLSPLALACASEWLISTLAGISNQHAGFQTLRLAPKIPTDDSLSFAKAHYDSSFGQISTHWRTEDNALLFDVVLPPNTSATIELPAPKGHSITESGEDVASSNQFYDYERTDSSFSVRILSGAHQFKISK